MLFLFVQLYFVFLFHVFVLKGSTVEAQLEHSSKIAWSRRRCQMLPPSWDVRRMLIKGSKESLGACWATRALCWIMFIYYGKIYGNISLNIGISWGASPPDPPMKMK